jgi:hypothetical protein
MNFQDFLKEFMNPKEREVHQGPVYYDSRTNRFLQLRKRHDDFYLFSDFKKFYDDSKTTISEQKLSPKYLEGCIEVECLDEHPELWTYNEFGWCVKEKK